MSHTLQSDNPTDASPASSTELPSFGAVPPRVSLRSFVRLEQALSAVREEFIDSPMTRFRVFVTGRPKALDAAIQREIFLIAREAVVNALCHSDAASVEVEIEYLPGKFRVIVRDNGRGIHPQTLAQSKHSGLLEMRERAATIGGQLRIWSRAGAGTEIEFCVASHIASFSSLVS